ncbi:hypothetical protein BH11BAC2_BH11BAC2_05220 [soil metagenome]
MIISRRILRSSFSNILLIIFCTLFFGACKKDATDHNPVPKITFVSATPSTVQEFTDSLVLKIYYVDGDGDLGENNPDVKNMFVTDNRIGITYQYRIQQLAPDNSSIPIQGNLNTVLNNVSITDGSSAQNATFSIYVVDRAGNKSNTVTSGNVTIVK